MRTASHRPWSPRLDRGKRRGDPPARGIRAVDAKAPRRLRYAASCTSCGISGESRLARYIAREVGDGVIALHDRLIPGTPRQHRPHLRRPDRCLGRRLQGISRQSRPARNRTAVAARQLALHPRKKSDIACQGRPPTGAGRQRRSAFRRIAAGNRPPLGAVSSGLRVGSARFPVPDRQRLGSVPRRPEEAASEERFPLARDDGENRAATRPELAFGVGALIERIGAAAAAVALFASKLPILRAWTRKTARRSARAAA
jgi:hypothetical protein